MSVSGMRRRLPWAGWKRVCGALSLVVCGGLMTACATPEAKSLVEAPQDISESADTVLRSACDALAASKAFSCSAEIWEDVVMPGTDHKMQRSRTVEVKVRRPDRVQAQMTSEGTKRIFYDGKSLVIATPADKLYGRVDVPSTIDETLDFVTDTYGVEFPLEDILTSDPYGSAVKRVKIGRYLGKQTILGVKCHHLGFAQETIDWQIWIEEGAKPLIRKLVITYKTDRASPQFTALFTAWDLQAKVVDADFVFDPAGSTRIEMMAHTLETVKQ